MQHVVSVQGQVILGEIEELLEKFNLHNIFFFLG